MELPMFPAHAGMIQSSDADSTKATDVPRTRGDDPREHIRGKLKGSMFPAHAGMILGKLPFHLLFEHVPRTRGDDPVSGKTEAVVR